MNISNKEYLANIAGLLTSLEEVDHYVITDMEGRVHSVSSDKYNESTINSCIYLWVTGSQFGNKFNLGEPVNLIYNLKARKMFIQKYNDYLIIFNLIDAAKFSSFKKKLYDRLSREI
jgi:hypothetical protein